MVEGEGEGEMPSTSTAPTAFEGILFSRSTYNGLVGINLAETKQRKLQFLVQNGLIMLNCMCHVRNINPCKQLNL